MKTKAARVFAGLMSGVFLMSAIPVMAAEPSKEPAEETTVTVNASMEKDNFYTVLPQEFQVSSTLSDTYGYVDQVEDGVSALDCLIAVHQNLFQEAFLPETKDEFLTVDNSGFIKKMMGEETSNVGFAVNGFAPNDGVYNEAYGSYTGLSLNQTKLNDHDVAQFFFYNPNGYWGEIYSNFVQDGKHVTEVTTEAGSPIPLKVQGYSFVYEGYNKDIKWKNVSEIQVCTLETEDAATAGQFVPIEGAVTDEEGNVQIQFDNVGTYYLGVTSNPDNGMYILPQICKVTVNENADMRAAREVKEQIEALNVQTLDDKPAVEAVRAAYDALTAEQKAMVPNEEALKAAEEKIVQLESVDRWILTDGKWWYRHGDGTYSRNAWEQINGTWYHFDQDGWMNTGWMLEGSTWYYFNGSGAMVTGWMLEGSTWYYFNGSGAMVTGWMLEGSTWYYFNGSGAMVKDWMLEGSTWYYFNESGAMATGWRMVNGTWYYFNASGAMATGWMLEGSTWYYFSGSGSMVTGMKMIDGTWYYFNASGAMLAG